MAFTVSSDKEQGDTRISNTFIQSYMAAANGSYVKLYLYLQMLCQHPDSSYAQTVRETTAVKELADLMECTEEMYSVHCVIGKNRGFSVDRTKGRHLRN